MQGSTWQDAAMNSKISQDLWMSDLDPMLEGGYRVALIKPVPIQIRYQQIQGKQIGKRDIVNMRIMVKPTIQTYSEIKLEITSQNDIFMLYYSRIDQRKFDKIKKTQGLNFNFSALLNMLIKQISFCQRNPEQYGMLLFLSSISNHVLSFNQNIQYKSIQMLSLDFETADDQLKKQCISYRFSNLKAKNERVQIKIKQVYGLIKLKNPNLLNTLNKKHNIQNISLLNTSISKP